MTVFTLLLAISLRLKPQNPDCIHCEDNLTKIHLPFSKMLLAVLETEISLVEGVGILISKVVEAKTQNNLRVNFLFMQKLEIFHDC